MVDLMLVPVAVFYLLVVGALFIYGINFFYLTYLSWKNKRLQTPPPIMNEYPSVTVQLPIYNERYVADRLIQAVGRLDYPKDRLEIQILDDSTDITIEIVAKAVQCLRDQGLHVDHIRREVRTGFKAGALAEGFARSSGEFLAVLDADFLPPSDFLKRTIPNFYANNNKSSTRPIAFIQTRWGHINRDYSFLTRLQALAIDAHFMVEQYARSSGGYWFNFNGTAGIWRREAIESAGGWTAETLTEDLDLSYRAFLKGWGALYLRDVEVPAELPASFTAYRRQQYRWARGSLECAIRLIPRVWKSPISVMKKIEATLHLTGYGVHLLLFCLCVLYPLVLLLSVRYPALISLFGIALIFNATAFAPTIFFVAAQQQLGRNWWRQIPRIVFITALGAGMMVNTMRAAAQVLGGKKGIFERTPKFGLIDRSQDWRGKFYQLRLDPLVFIELALALLNLFTVVLAFHLGNYVIGIYSALFTIGLLFTSGITIGQSLALVLHRTRSSAVVH
jgi:cellulose synthase/poly-beta-1,6-N-acetylglucosamine synthase-like glycosyltransferase